MTAAPARWLGLPRRTARLRLTLLYSGMFLLLGVVACSPRSDAKKAATTSGGSAASTLVPITTRKEPDASESETSVSALTSLGVPGLKVFDMR